MSDTTQPQTASRGRLITARLLAIIGLLVGAIALFAAYVNWQLFDTGTFEDTAAELIANEEIRTQVSARLVDELYANVDVKDEIAAQLPEDYQGFAGPLAGALRQLGDRAAYELLGRPRVQSLFVDAAVVAQRVAKRALEDDTGAIETQDGYIVLDLHQAVLDLADELSFLGSVADKIPEDAGVIKLVEANQFETAQEITQLFRSIAFVLPFLALALFGGAVWLARGKRRRELRFIAFGAIVVAVLLLVLRGVAGGIVVDDVSQTTAAEPAVQNAWNILTGLLADGAWTVIIMAIATLLLVWLSAPTGLGARVRHGVAPVLARRELGYPAMGLILLVLVWWQPTAQFGRWLSVITYAVLLAIALEALHRLVRREDPDAAQADPIDRLRGITLREPAAAASPAVATGAGAVEAPPPPETPGGLPPA
jgi:hypothetical protein